MTDIGLYLILIFLSVALFAYALFGGADYGMGILELLYPHEKEEIEDLSKKAIGPVWEANHVWIIIVVVILFIAFPSAFASLSSSHHIPLFLLLLGIVIRGTAFSFRHYDPIKDQSHTFHRFFFNISSVITPFILGVTIASLSSYYPIEGSFYDIYVWPWLNLFTVLSGLTYISITVLTAAVFAYFEPDSTLQPWLRKITSTLFKISLLLGAITALVGTLQKKLFTFHPILTCSTLLVGVLSCVILYISFNRSKRSASYFSIGGLIFAMFFGLMGSHFPTIYQRGAHTFTWFNDTSPAISIWILNAALIIGLLMVIPLLTHLFILFKSKNKTKNF